MTVATQSVHDPRLFRQALGQFPTGVCVVTASVAGERLGMTMSSFNSLSLDPPLVLFSIDRRAAGLPLWEQATRCTINVLAENQKDISNRFAKSQSNKWEGMRLRPGHAEAPALAGTAAVFECAVWAKHDRKPLVFCMGRYASLQPTESPAPLWPLDIHY